MTTPPTCRSTRMPALCLALLGACLAGGGGCSKQSGPDTAAHHPERRGTAEHVPGVPDAPTPVARPVTAGTYPTPDPATPDAEFEPVTSGAQLLFLYQAFSGLPPDLEKTAMEYSKEYAGTSDAFRRHDLLEALRPKFEALRAGARAHPYIRWDQDYTHVDHYDFARKGFLIKDPMLQEGGYGYMADIRGYNIHFTNGEALSFVPVPDENRARELEALFQKNNFPIRFFAFVQSADDRGEHQVHAALTKVQVLDRSGHVLLESLASR